MDPCRDTDTETGTLTGHMDRDTDTWPRTQTCSLGHTHGQGHICMDRATATHLNTHTPLDVNVGTHRHTWK